MSPNLLRGTLFGCGFSLALWGLIVLIWSLEAAVALAIAAMVLMLAGGFVARVDDECGYEDTVYGGDQ